MRKCYSSFNGESKHIPLQTRNIEMNQQMDIKPASTWESVVLPWNKIYLRCHQLAILQLQFNLYRVVQQPREGSPEYATGSYNRRKLSHPIERIPSNLLCLFWSYISLKIQETSVRSNFVHISECQSSLICWTSKETSQ